MATKIKAELIELGFPQRILDILDNNGLVEDDINKAIEFLKEKGLVSVDENANEISLIFPDEEIVRGQDSASNLIDPEQMLVPELGGSSTQNFTSFQVTQNRVLLSPHASPLEEVTAKENVIVVHRNISAKTNNTPESNSCTDYGKENTLHTNTELTPESLYKILSESLTGNDILKLAKVGPLSERRQLELAGILAQWHLQNKKKLVENDLRKYAQVITILLKYEKEDTYFLPRNGDKKNPGGKIYNKICNLKTKFRKRKIDDLNHLQKYSNSGNIRQDNSFELNQGTAWEALEWLNHNDGPWSTVLDMWKASFSLRKIYIGKPNAKENLIEDNLWRFLLSEYGYQLIDIDYQFLKSNRATEKWDHLLAVAGKYIRERSIDDSSCKLVDIFSNSTEAKDLRICALLLSLNCVLHPQKVTVSYKPTVLNGQNDTVLFANSDDEAKVKLAAVYTQYQSYRIPLTPKLIFFGTQASLTGVFRVYYGDLFYTLPSASRAVDVYIKLCEVLALKHSKISKLIWLFVQHYIYDLDIPERYASIDRLVQFLNQPALSNLEQDDD
ncbi:uncharacterized protein LOC131425651 [Malaya genurostris]|uniref:uncharacterized protein LOC131425651 n=1 Tax=Malaya genurostris TaxID=325434 RepID=UPI0026F3F034|nr:uncharacterized protein LOC131425651 [Malaya genurostris]